MTISDSTSAAAIYYTTDGSTPTTGSTRYTTAIPVNVSQTIKAIATATGYATSAVGSATYTITTTAVPVPTFSPGGGSYAFSDSPTVSISDTDPIATIYYTTNGSNPTTSSAVYSAPIQISSNTTLKAMGVRTGCLNSTVGSAVYSIQADPPTSYPPAGSYVGAQTVTLQDDTGRGTKIYYTTDGSTPTTSSALYSSAIAVNSTETIKAIAVTSGYANSPVLSAPYAITSAPSTPTFSPAAGTYSGTQLVMINESTLNAAVYYTVTSGATGTTPTTSSPVYTGGAITVGSTETLEAIAVVSGTTPSAAAIATYDLPAQAATSTTLSVTASGNSVTTISAGGTVQLTAAVTSNGAPLATGTVEFCDAAVAYCTDIHLLGTAQLTPAGNAAITLRPTGGVHSYQARFMTTTTYGASSSNLAQLNVTGLYPTTTTITASGLTDNYTVVGTVTGSGNIGSGNINLGPTGMVSFIDASNGNSVLASATLLGHNLQFSQAAGSNVSTTNSPSTVVAGDFNNDGIPDLAVLESGGNIEILLGNGDGTFRSAAGGPFSANGATYSMVVGDFNGDGKQDLALLSFYKYVVVFLGNGDGTFSAAQESSFATQYTDAMVAGDFNGDGKADLAVASYGDESVTVLVGNGDGTFTQGVKSQTGTLANSIVSGDFDGDGRLDLVVCDESSNAMTVLLSNGNGTFHVAPNSPITVSNDTATGGQRTFVVPMDVDHDGRMDLVALSGYDNVVTVFLGIGAGEFTTGASYRGIATPTFAATGDFNGDGLADIAVHGASTTYVFYGTSNGYQLFGRASSSQPITGAVADYNGDGLSDWAQISTNGTLGLVLSQVTQTATATATGVSPYGSGSHLVAANYAGDTTYAASTSATTALAADTLTAAPPPTFSPTPGVYTSAQTVSISDAAPGGTIYYTTDGSTPTTNSSVYLAPIIVTPTENVEAIATAPGYVQSSAAVGLYSLPPAAATPVFTPTSGAYTNSQIITISDGTSGATVYFTTDGTTPTTQSPVYTAPIVVSTTTTLKAIAVASGSSQSSVGSAFYTIGTTPTISTISPTQGPVGTVLTIGGTGFGGTQGSSGVTIGGLAAATSSWSDTQIQAAIPSGAGTGSQNVLVVVGANSSRAVQFTVSPAITEITPSSGNPGTLVSIAGNNFEAYVSGISAVTFNGQTAHVSDWTPTRIDVIAPPLSATAGGAAATGGATSGPVIVYAYNSANNSVTASNGMLFTVIAGPEVDSLSPSNGPVGTNVTIRGFNFGTSQIAGTVTFNGVAASPSSWNSESIIVPVPSGATSGPLVVTVSGVASNGYPFAVGSGITGVSPSAAGVGATVTITGTGFGTSQGSSTVNFNGVPAVVSSWSNATITTSVPSGATTGSLSVVVNGISNDGGTFAVVPVINSVTPASGIAGTVVTVSGTTFGAAQDVSTIAFGQIPAVPTQWTQNKITVPVPPGASTGSIVVTVGGRASNGMPFTVGSGSITGVVTNASGGAPLSGAQLQALQAGVIISSATSASDGSYTIASLPAGRYELRTSDAGFGTSVDLGVIVVVGSPTVVNVQLGPPGTIAGTVTQTDGTTAIAGATVTVLNSGDAVTTAQTNALGSYSIANLGAGSYDVRFSALGFNTSDQQNVSVSSGNTTTMNVSLAGQTTITYTYDEIGRLAGVTDSTKGSVAYSYDAVGNILSIAKGTPGQVSILDFTPKSGPVGTTVTISGTSFSANPLQDSVTIGGVSASVVSASPSQLVATVPSGTTTGSIAVTAPGGTATSATAFTVTTLVAGPIITSFDPSIANSGSQVQVTGSGFDVSPNDRVRFNGQPASIFSATGTNLGVNVPGNAGSGPITVATPKGLATGGDFFVVPTRYMPSQVDFTGRMGLGTPFTGAINTGGDIGLVLFSETSGESVNLQITNSTISGGTVSILNTNGSVITQTQLALGNLSVMSPPLAVTGTYAILVASNGSSIGSVTLNLSETSPGTIASGVMQTLSSTIPGQNVMRIFTGEAGQITSLQLANSTFTGSCYALTARILGPSGTQIASDNWCGQGNFFMNSVVLPATGTYTLVLVPALGGIGSVNATLTVAQPMPGTLSPGVPATLTTNAPGQTASLTFSSTSGLMLSAFWNNCTGQLASPGQCASGTFAILNPDGSTLSSSSVSGGTTNQPNPVTLTQTGTYTVEFTPQSGAVATAEATVWLYKEQVGTITTSTPAPPVIAINSPQQNLQLSFNATAGQTLNGILTNSTFIFSGCELFTFCSLDISILNPDGSVLSSWPLLSYTIGSSTILNPPTSNTLGSTNLPSSGTYTLVITPYVLSSSAVNVGSANLSVSVQ